MKGVFLCRLFWSFLNALRVRKLLQTATCVLEIILNLKSRLCFCRIFVIQ